MLPAKNTIILKWPSTVLSRAQLLILTDENMSRGKDQAGDGQREGTRQESAKYKEPGILSASIYRYSSLYRAALRVTGSSSLEMHSISTARLDGFEPAWISPTAQERPLQMALSYRILTGKTCPFWLARITRTFPRLCPPGGALLT